MSITYTPTTNFGAKDSLPANDPAKVIKGAEYTTEFTAIQSAFALAAPAASPTITGTATFDDVSITNGLTVDGTTLVVDDTANQVLLGTATPNSADTLNVLGAATFFGNATQVIRLISSSDTGSSEVRFGDPTSQSAGQYKFNHNGNIHEMIAGGVTVATFQSTKAYILGDLGIGTTAPIDKGANYGALTLSGASGGALVLADDGVEKANVTSVLNDIYLQSTGDTIFRNGGFTGSDETMRISSSGNVGIGESAPAAPLDVAGSIAITGTAGPLLKMEKNDGTLDSVLYYNNSNATNKMFIGRDSSELGFRTGVTERLTIDSSGNVGIGTDSPSKRLTVYATNPAFQLATAASGNTTLTYTDSTQTADLTVNASVGQLTFGTNSTERLRIDSAGRVGLGNDAPTAPLSILESDSSTTIGASTSVIKVRNASGVLGATSGLEFFHGNAETDVQRLCGIYGQYEQFDVTGFGGELVFATQKAGASSVTERMRIDQNGNVGIGETEPATTLEISSNATSQTEDSIPTVRLTNTDTTAVASDITGSFEFYSIDASSPDYISGYVRNVAEDAGVNYSLAFGTKSGNADAVEHVRINSAGKVGIGQTDPVDQLTVGNSPYASNQWERVGTVIGDTAGSYVRSTFGVKTDGGGTSRMSLDFSNDLSGGLTEVISAVSSGNVGIGKTVPARTLHVGDAMRLEPTSTPTSPSAGDLYFDSTTNKLRCYDGTTWQDCF